MFEIWSQKFNKESKERSISQFNLKQNRWTVFTFILTCMWNYRGYFKSFYFYLRQKFAKEFIKAISNPCKVEHVTRNLKDKALSTSESKQTLIILYDCLLIRVKRWELHQICCLLQKGFTPRNSVGKLHINLIWKKGFCVGPFWHSLTPFIDET